MDQSLATDADTHLPGDELAVLDSLEADLVAVEQAIDSLDRVTGEGLGGDAAAVQIDAIVSVGRFGPTASRSATAQI